MKNWLFLLIGVGILLASCTSVPNYNGDKSTLLIIPIKTEYENSQNIFGNYQLKINSRDTGQTVTEIKVPSVGNYILVRNLPPGEYYIGGITFYYRSDSPGSEESYNSLGHSFELQSGKITFTRYIYGQKNYWNEKEERFYMQKILILDEDGIYQQSVYSELLEKHPEEMASWEVFSFTGGELKRKQ